MKNLTGEQYAASKYIKLEVCEPVPLMEFLMKEMRMKKVKRAG